VAALDAVQPGRRHDSVTVVDPTWRRRVGCAVRARSSHRPGGTGAAPVVLVGRHEGRHAGRAARARGRHRGG
jgi:hypothetical protein